MSSMRARKAHEYKMAKLRKEIQDKDMRSNAIKKGFQVLNQMRSSMKDIVYSTTLILKVTSVQLSILQSIKIF